MSCPKSFASFCLKGQYVLNQSMFWKSQGIFPLGLLAVGSVCAPKKSLFSAALALYIENKTNGADRMSQHCMFKRHASE